MDVLFTLHCIAYIALFKTEVICHSWYARVGGVWVVNRCLACVCHSLALVLLMSASKINSKKEKVEITQKFTNNSLYTLILQAR